MADAVVGMDCGRSDVASQDTRGDVLEGDGCGVVVPRAIGLTK